MSPPPELLIVSPNPSIETLLGMAAEEVGLSCKPFESASLALQYLKENTPAVIVLDEGLDPDGFAIAARLKMHRRLRSACVVLLVAHSDEHTRATAEVSRADHVFGKPLDLKRFRQILRELPQVPPAS